MPFKRDMKKLWIVIAAGMLLGGCTYGRVERKPEGLRFPELRAVEKPQFTRERLANGMTVFLMEDRTLPLVSFQALIHTGAIYEPAEKTGLAEITFETLRTGGAGSLSGDGMDYALERIGARISTGIDRDIAWVEGLSHREDFPSVFGIFHDILTAPSFEQEKISLAVIGKKGEIRRRNDDISGIAEREFRRIVYGKESPYARISEYATIDSIRREDLVEFYGRFVCPSNIILGVWGDFDTADMLEKVRGTFGGWQKERIEKPSRIEVQFPETAHLNMIVKKDATQSVIMMGHGGLRRDHPDYFTAVVLSRILGAGWYSRFSRRLRQEKGLAYDVWASFLGEFDYPGLFIASAQTRMDRTFEVIGLMKKEIESVRENVSDEELAVAKDGILNSEVFWSDTKDKIIRRLMRYEYYGYPLDYPDRLIEGVKKVTGQDVIRVANELLLPGRLTVLVVGSPEKFDVPPPADTNTIPLNP